MNHLFSDLYDGLVILRLEDTIKPGLVDWESRVVTPDRLSKIRARRFQEVLANCNYAVELAKKLNLVVVGIAGESHDIRVYPFTFKYSDDLMSWSGTTSDFHPMMKYNLI